MPVFSAPAKINLSLRVLGRRSDGFHDLETLLVPISLADRIHLDATGPENAFDFTCSDESLPTDGTNLVVKAVELLRGHHGRLPGLRIHLEKFTPHGAGLGGGSSDAAVVLQAVNGLAEQPLGFAELVKLASELGSDVPFFLYGETCLGKGRGTELQPMPELGSRLSGRGILLVKLPFGVPTPWAYQQWAGSQELPGVDYQPQCLPWPGLEETLVVNDLERPVFAKHFVLAMLKTNLRTHPEVAAALMSGSGSTMIAFLKKPEPTKEFCDYVRTLVGGESLLIPAVLGKC